MSTRGAARRDSGAESPDTRSPFVFLLLVLLLSVPFVVVGEATGAMLLPGLPIAALQAVCPAIAAIGLVLRRHGIRGATAFLGHAFAAWPRGIQWPILILTPAAVLVVSWFVQRGLGVPVPVPQVDVVTIVILFAVFLVAAIAEELGWSSYALEPLRDRWGPLPAALIIGLAWSLMHVGALLQADREWSWIAWWAVASVALRVILVMVFARTGGGVMGVSLFHASYNTSWQAYPDEGSYWDPAVVAPILVILAVMAVLGSRHPLRRGGR